MGLLGADVALAVVSEAAWVAGCSCPEPPSFDNIAAPFALGELESELLIRTSELGEVAV